MEIDRNSGATPLWWDRPNVAAEASAQPPANLSADFGSLDPLLRDLESQFALVMGRPDRVLERCQALAAALSNHRELADDCLRRILPLLPVRQGAMAQALLPYLRDQALAGTGSRSVVIGMLHARDEVVRKSGLDLALELVEAQQMPLDLDVLQAIADLLDAEGPASADASGRRRLAEAIRLRPASAMRATSLPVTPGGVEDPLEALLVHGPSLSLRHLAADLLDQAETPAPPGRLARLFGADASTFLAPYLAYTRATHRSLVDLTPDLCHAPALVDSLREAERLLGRPLLGQVIGELGWDRLAWGITCHRLIGLSLDGGFPLVVSPEEAAFLESCTSARRVWDRYFVIAHGGIAAGESGIGEEAAQVQRFRQYNVLHAELLGEILEVAPVTPAKVGRILERLEQVVALFAALFQGHAEEAAHVGARYQALQAPIRQMIAGAPPDQPLAADVTRLVQMFEDPRSLDEVRTLHGLKRYLHQQGLRHAFRVFRSGRATNRTVDLLLASGSRVLHVVRRIRYIDFEPEPGGGGQRFPFPVALVVELLGRRLVHGKVEAPDFELLAYGNEVQVFISFRNHPVFLRMDLSPPQRGGMLDLEYFGVSQYELDQHPDPSLQWVQRIFRRLDFDVRAEGLRLHIRYDKERALDLGDLIRHARLLGYLLPHLMELDWTIASLSYPEAVKARVADAWADLVPCWGWLPTADLLTTDRRRILLGTTADPSGEREIPWDGQGDYRDRFLGVPSPAAWERIRAALEARGLADRVPHEETMGPPAGQLQLEAQLLDPLQNRLSGQGARPSDTAAPSTPERVPATDRSFRHEVERLADLLVEGGSALTASARLAFIVGSVERHVRFVTCGSIQGYPVQRATLVFRGEEVEVAVLRDADGIPRLALAVEHPGHLWPGAGSPPQRPGNTDLGTYELTRRLRRDNYVGVGAEPPADQAGDAAALASLFTVPHALAPAGLAPGDLIVQGIVASPGKAAGFARLGADARAPEELDGAILLSPAVRPVDTALIRRSAAVVSTGGGILSHAGLIALELGKPALVISGRWQHDADGSQCLAYRHLDYREEECVAGPYRLVLRRDLREREGILREGDLVVVDAEVGTLGVLGQDRDTLALQQELRQLDAVAGDLHRHESGPELLVLRGRWLRAVHQLKKILSRIERPALARYAARELLLARSTPSATHGGDDIARLLLALLANPACGEIAGEAARQQQVELAHRYEAYVRTALRVIPTATSLTEILYLRLGAGRTGRRLQGLTRSLQSVGIAAAATAPDTGVDHLALRRIEELRCALIHEVGSVPADPATWWSRRHLLDRLESLELVLGAGEATCARAGLPQMKQELADLESTARTGLCARAILYPRDGGRELSPMIGGKGANLGEISRILGSSRVPSWFAVSHEAFLQIMNGPPGRGAGSLGLEPQTAPTLNAAISHVLGRREIPLPRKASAIRLLWQGVVLPSAVSEEIARAYRSLDGAGGEDPNLAGEQPAESASAPRFVAIRSSAFEEDTELASWTGQFDTFLFVRGVDAVLEHIKLAMASLWTERALEQRALLGDPGREGGGGVIVQRIVEARAAGVLHTLSATAGQAREMVINVGLGLGEGVVSGTVEVDHIVVSRETDLMTDPLRFRYLVGDKSSQVVFDRRTGSGTRRAETLYHQRLRPALEYSDLCELVQAAALLEQTYGHPLDIEFAFEKDDLYILQVRPIVAFRNALHETVAQMPLPAGVARDGKDGHP